MANEPDGDRGDPPSGPVRDPTADGETDHGEGRRREVEGAARDHDGKLRGLELEGDAILGEHRDQGVGTRLQVLHGEGAVGKGNRRDCDGFLGLGGLEDMNFNARRRIGDGAAKVIPRDEQRLLQKEI